MNRLVGSQIVLREYIISDHTEIYKWRSDEKTTLWMGRKYRQPITLEEVKESLYKVINIPSANSIFYAIADKVSFEYIGGIDLTDIDWIDKNAILSIVIADAHNRNKGYASEAIQLLLKYAFHEKNLHKVSLNVFEKNEPAYKCYVNNGFHIEGTIRDYMLINGEYCNLIQMGILDSEFKEK